MSSIDTKKKIARSLQEMMRQKSLTNISVVDICASCDINRRTFYYHFDDRLDLLCWIMLEDLASMGFLKQKRHWSESCMMIFSVVKQNVEFFRNILHSADRDRFLSFLYEISLQYFYNVINRMYKRYDPEFEEFARRFYTHAYVMSALDWIEKGAPGSPQKLFTDLSACTELDFKNQIGEP